MTFRFDGPPDDWRPHLVDEQEAHLLMAIVSLLEPVAVVDDQGRETRAPTVPVLEAQLGRSMVGGFVRSASWLICVAMARTSKCQVKQPRPWRDSVHGGNPNLRKEVQGQDAPADQQGRCNHVVVSSRGEREKNVLEHGNCDSAPEPFQDRGGGHVLDDGIADATNDLDQVSLLVGLHATWFLCVGCHAKGLAGRVWAACNSISACNTACMEPRDIGLLGEEPHGQQHCLSC